MFWEVKEEDQRIETGSHIAMTGWGEYPGALARDAKADLVLNKPFELEDLDRYLSELLVRKS
jgi:hypothetical protein